MRLKSAEFTGWGRVLKARGQMARPEKIATLKALQKQSPCPAVGNRRSYGDACLNSDGLSVDMTRLDRLLNFDTETGVLQAEAGITIGEIAEIFAPKGWLPAVMPGTGFATLGGCIAHDVHGKNHHQDGSFGQHVVSLELLGANGRVRSLSPDSPGALFRATIGGLGQTGVILSARIQLTPCASEVMEVRESRAQNLDEFLEMLEGSTARYNVGWIDATAKGVELGRGILEEAALKTSASPLPQKPANSIPMDAPKLLLSPPVVQMFNQAYLRRVPVAGRQTDRSLQDFFFPLDRVHNWNRLYGKAGFHQFQAVLPGDSARAALTEMLELIATAKLASPLAVLKRLGPGRAGMMSFPMAGFTLAVDFPNRAKTTGLIQALEDITLGAGGRIYLAKDALSRSDRIKKMYGESGEFAKIITQVDPQAVFATDMVKRLKLRDLP